MFDADKTDENEEEAGGMTRLLPSILLGTFDCSSSSDLVAFVEKYFLVKERQTTFWREVKCGVLHFVSCVFILAVNPSLLEPAGYSVLSVASGTALATGFSCILCGVFSNLPFVLAPTTSTSIYFSIFLQNRAMPPALGQGAIFLLGVLFSICGIKRVALVVSNTVPFPIKVGVCLGVGLLIALEALIEIGLVRTGEHTVLDIGEFTIEIYIAMCTFAVIGISLHYKIRGSFLIGLTFGTVLYWTLSAMTNLTTDPHKYRYTNPTIEGGDVTVSFSSLISKTAMKDNRVYRLVFDLFIIGIILLNGLTHGLAHTSGLKREEDNTLPRGKWLYLSCGIGTMLAAGLGCGPIMISPESAPAIKAGARTGLSSCVCGFLFLLSTIICPVFAMAPAASTSPVLLMIGMMLFENARLVDWSQIKEAIPIFLMTLFIPFTYSILNGVIFGFGMYCIMFVFTENELFARKLRLLYKKLLALCGGSSSRIGKRDSNDLYVALSASDHDPSDLVSMDHDSDAPISPAYSSGLSKQGGHNLPLFPTISDRSSYSDENEFDENFDIFDVSTEPSHFLSFQMNEINDGVTAISDRSKYGKVKWGSDDSLMLGKASISITKTSINNQSNGQSVAVLNATNIASSNVDSNDYIIPSINRGSSSSSSGGGENNSNGEFQIT